MGFDDALIFTRVVEYHSFTQATQSLGIQKLTVSRRIALLEERLGVRLLNRTIRKLRLAKVGQTYYEYCRQIMYDFAEAKQAVMQLQQAPSGSLWVTSPIESGQMLLASLLSDFMRQCPRITIEVELTSCSVGPLQEDVDTTIVAGQPGDSTLVAYRLLSTSRWLYTSPDYLVAHSTPVSVAELARHRAVLLSADSRRHWSLSGDSLPCRRMLSYNNITFARRAVVTGAGIAALSVLTCVESVHSRCPTRLLAGVSLPVGKLYVIHPSWCFQAMEIKAFLDFLINRLPADTGCSLGPEAAHPITSHS